jgi:class 3 adenylate cyclase
VAVGHLTIEQLAVRSGVDDEMVERLVAAGLVEADVAGLFPETDVARLRLVAALVDSGSSIEEMALARDAGRLTFDFIGLLMPHPVELVPIEGDDDRSLEPFEHAIRPILGGERSAHDPMRADDLAIVHVVRRAVALGAPLERVVRIARSMALVAQKLVELQRDFVDEVLLGPAIERTGSPVAALAETAADRVEYRALGRELSGLLVERFVDDAIFDNLVQLTEVALDVGGVPLSDRSQAVVFIDVSEYTRRSEELGDAESARQAVLLADFSRDLARRHGARLVKSLGDGAMFHTATTDVAVILAIDAVEGAASVGLWPLHAGVNCGAMVRRDGDYYGAAVNTASRVADQAAAGQVLVTAAVVRGWTGEGVGFEPRGEAVLKNVRDPVVLFEATRF